MNTWNKKDTDRYKERFWSVVAVCIMKIILNCSRKWDFVLFICCPGCIRPWGKQESIHAKSGSKACLCIKHEPNNSTRGQPFCQLFQVLLAGSRSAECKLLPLFYFVLLICDLKYIVYFLICFMATTLNLKNARETILFVISTLSPLSFFSQYKYKL